MPAPGKRWRHVIINTRGSWLHGDARGFRSREHRIHSSGDYRNPPAVGEHAGLREYHDGRSPSEIRIRRNLRPVVGAALLAFFAGHEYAVLVIAVTMVHAHALVELPDNIVTIRGIVGRAKGAASRAVKRELPGSVWGRGGTYKPIKDRAHQLKAYDYILYDQGREAWTWSFRDKSNEGMFGRSRE